MQEYNNKNNYNNSGRVHSATIKTTATNKRTATTKKSSQLNLLKYFCYLCTAYSLVQHTDEFRFTFFSFRSIMYMFNKLQNLKRV